MNLLNGTKSGIALTVVAVVIFVASVAGVDRKMLRPKVDKRKLLAVHKRNSEASLKEGSKLEGRLAKSLHSKYVIAEVDPFVPETPNKVDEISVVGVNDPGLQIIHVNGIMKTKGEAYQAIVNNSLVSEDSSVYGCKIVKISENAVSFDVNGKVRTISINEQIKVDAQTSQSLVLDDISVRNGVWVAEIGGSLYRSGDWIDKQTQIRAVTPTQVMVARAGSMIFLKLEK